MSINISAIELLDPFFVPMVKTILADTGVPGQNIEFEISEMTMLASIDQIADIIEALRSLGIQIAIDDFGANMTYLNLLKKLSIDTLKIEKTFIDAIDDENTLDHSVASLVSMGHLMNRSVVAKGVETTSQLDYLKKHHCDGIQGYLWAQPLDENAFTSFLAQLSV